MNAPHNAAESQYASYYASAAARLLTAHPTGGAGPAHPIAMSPWEKDRVHDRD
jgi:hypothetical protein